jgi:hypothetical protein
MEGNSVEFVRRTEAKADSEMVRPSGNTPSHFFFLKPFNSSQNQKFGKSALIAMKTPIKKHINPKKLIRLNCAGVRKRFFECKI